MKIVDISHGLPSLDDLEKSVKDDDAVLIRDGHVVLMVRAFDDEDWADWKFEHSAELQEKSHRIQTEMEQGMYVTLDDLDRELEA